MRDGAAGDLPAAAGCRVSLVQRLNVLALEKPQQVLLQLT
jgi:hypothetical protein